MSTPYKETDRGLEIEGFPLARENEENAKGRVYLPGSLKSGVDSFNELVSEFPYYKLIPDGHVDNPEHKFSVVVGMIDSMYYDSGGVFVDIVFFNGSRVTELVRSVLDAGGPVSMSMECITFGKYTTRSSAKRQYPDVRFLPDDMGQSRLFLVERTFIFGASLVDSPSFRDSYVQAKESAPTLMRTIRQCVGNVCSSFVQEGGRLCPRIDTVRRGRLFSPEALKELTKGDVKEILNYLVWLYGEDEVLETFNRCYRIFKFTRDPMRVLRKVHEELYGKEVYNLWINLVFGLLYLEFELVRGLSGLKMKWSPDISRDVDRRTLVDLLGAINQVDRNED